MIIIRIYKVATEILYGRPSRILRRCSPALVEHK